MPISATMHSLSQLRNSSRYEAGLVLSRVHATQQFTLSVRWSVRQSRNESCRYFDPKAAYYTFLPLTNRTRAMCVRLINYCFVRLYVFSCCCCCCFLRGHNRPVETPRIPSLRRWLRWRPRDRRIRRLKHRERLECF